MPKGRPGDSDPAFARFVWRSLTCTSRLVGQELGRSRQKQNSSVTQLARTVFVRAQELHPAAGQPDVVGGSAVGVVAWMSARRSAWSFAWLSVQCVRRRRRSARGTSPVT